MKRRLFLALVPFLIFSASGLWAANDAPPPPLYVAVNNKPPSVVFIDAEKLKTLATVSLEEHPVIATWSADHKYVYVLCAKEALGIFQTQGSVAVIDVAKQAVLKTIKIGWNPDRRPIISLDRRYIGYHCKGRKESKKEEGENAALWVLDTTTNELVNTYRSNRYIPLIGDMSSLEGYAAASDDLAHLFVFSQLDTIETKKPLTIKPTLSLFSREQSAPLAVLEFDHSIRQVAFSPDQKWLYALDAGRQSKKAEESRPGKLFVIDVATGKIAKEHAVGSDPQWFESDPKSGTILLPSSIEPDNKGVLYKIQGAELTATELPMKSPKFTREFDGLDGRLLVSDVEIRQLDDKGASAPILINKAQKGDSGGPYLEGTPGEMAYVPTARRLVVSVLNAYGERTGDIGVIDMENKKVLAKISTGHFASMFLKQLALAAGSGMVQGYNAAYGTHLYAPTGGTVSRPENNMQLWPEPSGKLAYALNQSTGELHVIELSTGAVAKVLKLNKESSLKLAPSGQYLLGGSGTLSILDLKSGTMRELPIAGGKIRFMTFDSSRNRALVFTRKSMIALDYASGQQTGSIDDFDLELFAGSPLAQ